MSLSVAGHGGGRFPKFAPHVPRLLICAAIEPTWVQAITTLSSFTVVCLRQSRPQYATCVHMRVMQCSLNLLEAEFWSSMESALPVTVRAACIQAMHDVLQIRWAVHIASEGEDSLGSF